MSDGGGDKANKQVYMSPKLELGLFERTFFLRREKKHRAACSENFFYVESRTRKKWGKPILFPPLRPPFSGVAGKGSKWK